MGPIPATAQRRKVLIVDDHPIVRQGLRSMIDAELAYFRSDSDLGQRLQRGADGIYTMTPQDHMGLSLDSFKLVEVKNNTWKLIE